MNYEEYVNEDIQKKRFLDTFLGISLNGNVFAVVQNRVPDLPEEMKFLGVFKSSDSAVEYANQVFDAYHLKGRADAFRVDVLEYRMFNGYFHFKSTFYNCVKFGD